MNLKVYAVKDTKVGEFMSPWVSNNEQTALRALRVVVNEKGTDFDRYAEDMQLYQLGDFDTKTGNLKAELKFIINHIDLKEKE